MCRGSIISFHTCLYQKERWRNHPPIAFAWAEMVDICTSRCVFEQNRASLGSPLCFSSSPEGDETQSPPDDAVLRRQLGPTTVGGRQVTHTVYEYNDSNVGNYSPTNVMIARDAPSILQHLWRTSFDPRQSIILPERIEEPLVQATGGKMFFERGAIRVQAESRGHSLLLLPVQYSHCLVLSEPVTARLLPANLVQTAVLFQGSIDLRIHFEYGLLPPRVSQAGSRRPRGIGYFR